MIILLQLTLKTLLSIFQTRQNLVLENLALRQQLAVLNRSVKRPPLTPSDRMFWVMLSRIWSHWAKTLLIVQPETVVRWHRESFRCYWAWKSKVQRPGRPSINPTVRDLIRNMSRANPLWGAPRIHGELLKLDIQVSQATVSKYMIRNRKPPSQSWRTFLNNHLPDLVSIDFFTVPTATFRVLYVFIVLSHERRSVLHFNVTDLCMANYYFMLVWSKYSNGESSVKTRSLGLWEGKLGIRPAQALLRSKRTKLTIPLWAHQARALSHHVLVQGEGLVFFRVKGGR